MTLKYFNVKNGLTTGNITLNAGNSNISASTFIGNINVTSSANLGNVGNVRITGGTSGYVLSTDGAGNLSWVEQSGGGGTPGGTNTQIQFNDGGTFGGNANLTFDKVTSVLTVTGNIAATNANLGNLTTSNYFTGNGSLLSSITGSNVTGQVANSLIAGTVYTNAQPNITSVGTLTNLNVSGNAVIGGNLTVDGDLVYVNVTNLAVEDPIIQLQTGSNGAAPSSNTGKDVGTSLNYYDTQARIAFMGWDVSNAEFGFGNVVSISSEVVTWTSYGNVRAGYFIGNGSQLTGITSAAYANYISNGTSNVNIPTASGNVTIGVAGNANIVTVTGTGINVAGTLNTTGNANVGNIGATNGVFTNISGNGSALTSITGANVTGQVGNALVAGTVYTAAQPNITSVGLLTALSVGPNSSITLTGTSGFVKANSIQGTDGVNAIYPAYSGAAGAVGITGNLTVGIGIAANITANGNVTANYFIGNGSSLTSVAGANVTGTVANANYAAYAGNVTVAAQSNITSLGTLTGLTSNGIINFTNASNVSLGAVGNIKITGGTANYVLSTDGAGNLSWVAQSGGGGSGTPGGSNTQIQFNDANTFAGSASLTFDKTTNTLTTNNFIVSTTANLGDVANVTITGGADNYYLKTDGTGNLSWATTPSTAITVDTFSGNGSQTTFTLTATPTNINQTVVNIDGVFQLREAYALSGANIIFDSAPVNGSVIEVTTTQGVSTGSGSFVVRNYTGNGVQTTFPVTNGVTASSVLVTENGILQVPTSDYTVSGANLTFTSAPANAMAIQIRELGVVVAQGTTVSGSNTQIQFNDAGAFAGNANLTFDKTTGTLNATNVTANGTPLATTGKAIAMAIVFGF